MIFNKTLYAIVKFSSQQNEKADGQAAASNV